MDALAKKALITSKLSLWTLLAGDAVMFLFCNFQMIYYRGDGFGNLPIDAPIWMHWLKHAMGWALLLQLIPLVTALFGIAFSLAYWLYFKRLVPLLFLIIVSVFMNFIFGTFILW